MNPKFREWCDSGGWIVLVSAVLIVLGLLAILSQSFRSLIASGTTAAWGSAIGTFAAAATALYVSRQQESKESKEKSEIGLNVVASITPELGRVYITLVKLAHMMKRISASRSASDRHERERQQVLLLLDELVMDASTASFEKLHYMPGQRGRHVAALIGIIPDLKRHLSALAKTNPPNQPLLEYHHLQASVQIGRATKSIMHGLGVGEQLKEVNDVLMPHVEAAAKYFSDIDPSIAPRSVHTP